jgi:hypothetical protein
MSLTSEPEHVNFWLRAMRASWIKDIRNPKRITSLGIIARCVVKIKSIWISKANFHDGILALGAPIVNHKKMSLDRDPVGRLEW